MNTLEYILKKFNLTYNPRGRKPVEIPDFDRKDLANLFKELGFNRGAEVGVEKGVYSEILCKANSDLELYCIDVWESYSGYLDFVRSMSSNYEETKKRLAPYKCHLIKKYSMDAVKDFEDESLDFVYIDANHDLQHVVNDLVEWHKKVKVGGIIAGDDYKLHVKPSRMHVVEAVNAYTWTYDIIPYFVLGLKDSPLELKRDNNRNFMWVRPPKVKNWR